MAWRRWRRRAAPSFLPPPPPSAAPSSSHLPPRARYSTTRTRPRPRAPQELRPASPPLPPPMRLPPSKPLPPPARLPSSSDDKRRRNPEPTPSPAPLPPSSLLPPTPCRSSSGSGHPPASSPEHARTAMPAAPSRSSRPPRPPHPPCPPRSLCAPWPPRPPCPPRSAAAVPARSSCPGTRNGGGLARHARCGCRARCARHGRPARGGQGLRDLLCAGELETGVTTGGGGGGCGREAWSPGRLRDARRVGFGAGGRGQRRAPRRRRTDGGSRGGVGGEKEIEWEEEGVNVEDSNFGGVFCIYSCHVASYQGVWT